jgi:RNA polymerase-binding protein DksA
LACVERNALRAGLVERAEDWRWSSLWHWQHPDVTEEVPPLTIWPVDRPRQWLFQVNRRQGETELESLQTAVQRGRSFGSEIWQAMTAQRLGLESTFHSRGRPKNSHNGTYPLHYNQLVRLRAGFLGDASQMTDTTLIHSNVVRMPSDMADVGTDAFEQELTLDLLGNEKKVLEQIDAALKRIEDGSYGRCEECGRNISKARLAAIPYAALCVRCAAKAENGRSIRKPG